MVKRVHMLKARPGQLRAGWGRPGPGEAPDVVYAWGAAVMEGRSLREELDRRGYDISTLRFSITQKQTSE